MPSLREQYDRLHGAIVAEAAPAEAEAAFGRERLAVYRHAYRARLEEALRVNYPALAATLGEEAFGRVAAAHARRRPPSHYSIRWHGVDLPADLPAGPLAELARMDWALGEAFDAADAAPLDREALARVAPEEWPRVPLALHPAARVLMLEFAVEPLWQAARRGAVAPCAAAPARRHALIVWRKAREVQWRAAARGEGEALLALGRAGTLEAACEGATEAKARRIGERFALWVDAGILVRREPPAP